MTELQNGRFGINMIRFCKEHEQYIQKQMAAQADLKELLRYHDKKLQWLQHERLVHLLVTMLTAVFMLFLFGIVLFCKTHILIIALLLVFILLLAAYLFHYFRLENTVQHWYALSELIYEKINEKNDRE